MFPRAFRAPEKYPNPYKTTGNQGTVRFSIAFGTLEKYPKPSYNHRKLRDDVVSQLLGHPKSTQTRIEL